MAVGIPVMVVGASSSGKSTSMRNLPEKAVCYLNAERKPLPFRKKNFNKYADVTSTTQLVSAMKAVEKDNTVKIVVIDSISMLASGIVYKEMVVGTEGFEGWQNYRDFLISVVDMAKASKKHYIFTALEDQIQDHRGVNHSIASVQGSLKGKLESHFSIVFRSSVIDDIDSPSGVSYKFATNQIPGEKISAKSPLEMFSDTYIDNDINAAFKVINEYYK